MTKDILIIRNRHDDFVGKRISSRGYTIMSPYIRDYNIGLRFLRRMHFRTNFPISNIWFNKNLEVVSAKIIIVFESLISKQFLTWLRKIHPKARIIVWYWNIVDNTIHPSKISDETIEKWSFSRKDSLLYNMKFNPAPYFKEILVPESLPEYDISFVGKDKGRLKEILAYENLFQDLGLKTKILVTPENKWKMSSKYHKPIPYSEVLNITGKSKAILDYIEVTDSGQSMRVFEALFNKKKLITNSQLIIDYDFYDKDNIFILNVDNPREIKKFINSPYKEVDEEIILKYDFDNWIRRFVEEDRISNKMMNSSKLKDIMGIN